MANGDLLRKGALGTRLILPPATYCLTDPEKLREEKDNGSDEHASKPDQSATHDGIGVDTDDREEDGKASAPYDGIEGGGYEVVGCDAVEP